MKFLIVDDHSGVRALIRSLVASPADDVRECASTEEALLVAREFEPDLVTMDVRLQKFDGIAATRALRELCPSARVVIVTSYDQPALRKQAAAAGAVHFVSKDNLLELRLLVPHLASILAEAAARRESEENS
jgi:DNA-binding NarL/FixJ family response regulator